MEGLLALAKSMDNSFIGTKEPFFFFSVFIQLVISKAFAAFDHSL